MAMMIAFKPLSNLDYLPLENQKRGCIGRRVIVENLNKIIHPQLISCVIANKKNYDLTIVLTFEEKKN